MDEFVSKKLLVAKFNELASKYTDGDKRQRGLAYATAADMIAFTDAANVQPVKQWISVKDRQPQESGFYLTYYSKQIHVSQWFISANWYNEHGGNVTNNVEYWQPLPEPPKDGDVNG